ncbi:MAG: two-component sensor histidine kinase [Caulobacterales bacterium 68-7]|nr:HAMP domain-containing protein [Caulobacterales bacterium]OJU10655.1 MAG: two-component sensor histidine kinase [Caulobacterales bacterium 68-7]
MRLSLRQRLGSGPLFLQAIGLVIVTLMASQIVSTIFLMRVPQPPPDVYRASEVAQALRTRQRTDAREGRSIVVKTTDNIRGAGEDNRREQEFKHIVAEQLAIDPTRVQIWTDPGPRFVIRDRRPPRKETDNRRRPGLEEPVVFGDFEVAVLQPDGFWLAASPDHRFRLAPWQQRILLINLLSALIVSPLAWLFARRMSAPLATFARAAEQLGRDPNAPPLEMGGSTEVVSAVASFNQMQRRLRRYVEDRTAMVGAIAHDLRTPLTRLRFRIEGAPDDVRAKSIGDIDQMDEMISTALAFVRDATQPGDRSQLELASLLETVFDDAAESGADVKVDRSEKIVIRGDSMALRRLISNLVENALKFGGQARGRLTRSDGYAIIEIEDDGPGVPPEEMERVFEPFYRREPSRNRETGGIGLGLAVVRTVARAHGGDVTLHNRDGGGLTARVSLPI